MGSWYDAPGGAATSVNDTDTMLVNQGGVSRTVTRGQLLDGVQLKWQGDYSDARAYKLNHSLRFLGSVYYCIIPTNAGESPALNPEKWQLLSSKGDKGTLAVGAVTTGAAGSSVVITNVGTPTDAVLNITIPQGVQGIQGIQGLTGNPYKAYATKALATADLVNIPADALIWINNDTGTPANNGYWTKTGGALVQSPNDRVTALERATNIFDPSANGANVAAVAAAVADLQLVGCNAAKYYTLTSVSRGNGGSWYLKVYQADDTTGTNLLLVAQYLTNVSPENGTWQTITLSTQNASGVSGTAVVKWENFAANALITLMWANQYKLAPFVFGTPRSGQLPLSIQASANAAAIAAKLTPMQTTFYDAAADGANVATIALGVADLRLKGTDPTKIYCLASVARNNGGWYLKVYQVDDNAGTNPVMVCAFNTLVNPETNAWQAVTLSTVANGITGTAWVKWEKLPAASLYNSMFPNHYKLGASVFTPVLGSSENAATIAVNTAKLATLQTSIFDPSATGAQVAAISAAIADVQLVGLNPAKIYTLASIARNDAGTWYVKVYQCDDAIGTNFVLVAQFYSTVNPETGGYQPIILSTIANGVSGTAIIKWENLATNFKITSMWANQYPLGAIALGPRVGVNAATEALKSSIVNSKALTNGTLPVTWLTGGYITKVDGTVVSSNSYKYTDFIPFPVGRNLTLYGEMLSNSACCAYDANKTFIASALNNVSLGDHTVILPAGTAYIRLSWNYTGQVETLLKSTDYDFNLSRLLQVLGLGATDLSDFKATAASPAFTTNINLTFQDNYYIHIGTGVASYVSNGTWRACNYVPVVPGQSIVYNGYLLNQAGICGYDANMGYVQDLVVAPNPPSGVLTTATFTIPAGVYFIRACSEVAHSPYFTLSYVAKELDITRLKGLLGIASSTNSIIGDFEAKRAQTALVNQLSLLAANLNLPSTAIGRVPSGGGPAPTIALTTAGYTHPSVKYFPGGWNGYEFWMVVSPYFGPVGTDSQYENPHIFCSRDGITWIEPVGIINPLALPNPYPAVGYLSDPHLELDNDGYLYCFFRGNGNEYGGRGIYYRRSSDGVNWSPTAQLYTTDSLASVDGNNLILSPAYLKDGNFYNEFVGVQDSGTGLSIPSQKNQSEIFVFRRASRSLTSFGEYDLTQIVNFTSRPWGTGSDPWHLNICKVGNLWLMVLCTGVIGSSSGSTMYLCYSKDGWNFDVVPTPLFANSTYRSTIVPISVTGNQINLYVYQASTSTGSISLYSLTLTVS